jgi:hypothetical protein
MILLALPAVADCQDAARAFSTAQRWRKFECIFASEVPSDILATSFQRDRVKCPLEPWIGLIDGDPPPLVCTYASMASRTRVRWRPWNDVDFYLEWVRW